ncbi:hypothetical protein DP22_4484 (plasmid) [Salmonella enterica subsp. enterica serovar Enteritidis]|nr:hypothetical protein DP22_4484 [Salmonella enterica subsp. enterica serovar Enteritidis]
MDDLEINLSATTQLSHYYRMKYSPFLSDKFPHEN